MSRENLVVRREKDRRATAHPEQEQLAGIGMREDLGDARWLDRTCPDFQRHRETDLATAMRDLLLTTLEQICDASHPSGGRNQRVGMKTELAGQIAAGRPEGQHTRSGQEMVERFFLDRVDAKAARAAVAEQLDTSCLRATHEAQASLPIAQLAGSRAYVALHTAVVQRVPVARVDDRAFRRPYLQGLRRLSPARMCDPVLAYYYSISNHV